MMIYAICQCCRTSWEFQHPSIQTIERVWGITIQCPECATVITPDRIDRRIVFFTGVDNSYLKARGSIKSGALIPLPSQLPRRSTPADDKKPLAKVRELRPHLTQRPFISSELAQLRKNLNDQ